MCDFFMFFISRAQTLNQVDFSISFLQLKVHFK